MYSIKRAISIYTLYFTFVLSLTSITFYSLCMYKYFTTHIGYRSERAEFGVLANHYFYQSSSVSIFLLLGLNNLCSLPPMNLCDNTAEHQSFIILYNHSTYSINCDIHRSFCWAWNYGYVHVNTSSDYYAADTTILFWVLNHHVGLITAIVIVDYSSIIIISFIIICPSVYI